MIDLWINYLHLCFLRSILLLNHKQTVIIYKKVKYITDF